MKGKKEVFLTFDDGPIPVVTEFVLEALELRNAKATFFCIGDNIKKNPTVFNKVLVAGHAVGNHTMNHVKAWKSSHNNYIQNVMECTDVMLQNDITDRIQPIFRPPYGQISHTKLRSLHNMGYKIVLWDVLSKDYNTEISPPQCLSNVIENVENGSIVVFHDSKKAFKNLQYALPKVLDILSKQGYSFKSIIE